MNTVVVSFEFDYAHRVLGHEGKCRYLHGHRAKVEVAISSRLLNNLGMVVDFTDIKQVIGTWIDLYLDHNILLNTDDPLMEIWQEHGNNHPIFAGRAPFVLLRNPTAEVIAETLFGVAKDSLPHPQDLTIDWVRVYETPSCSAVYTPEKTV